MEKDMIDRNNVSKFVDLTDRQIENVSGGMESNDIIRLKSWFYEDQIRWNYLLIITGIERIEPEVGSY